MLPGTSCGAPRPPAAVDRARPAADQAASPSPVAPALEVQAPLPPEIAGWEGLALEKNAGEFLLSFLTPSPPPAEDPRAQQMAAQVEELRSQGFLARASGEYHPLPDFDASWAQINYYDWLPTGYEPRDFVLRAQAEWQSASEGANWWNSGCGFIFRLNARGDHYLVLFALDGWVYLYRSVDRALAGVGAWQYAPTQATQAGAALMLAVEGAQIAIFTDGRLVGRVEDEALNAGLLGYALASGTNKDYGTRCRMQAVELWELK